MVHTSNPSCSEGGGRRIEIQRSAWAKLGRPYYKNKIKTKGLEVWLKRYSACLASFFFSSIPNTTKQIDKLKYQNGL
jgi:hypothetical protein